MIGDKEWFVELKREIKSSTATEYQEDDEFHGAIDVSDSSDSFCEVSRQKVPTARLPEVPPDIGMFESGDGIAPIAHGSPKTSKSSSSISEHGIRLMNKNSIGYLPVQLKPNS